VTTRCFHLGDVLSITTGKLVSPRLIDGVYDILNFMTGDNLFTHQIPRASRECEPHLLRQHPQLATVSTESVDAQTWRSWLDAQVQQFGEYLDVEPIPQDDHVRKEPLTELIEMVGPERVIVVDPNDA
jgi:hypothetical protein